jgi:hypothetical protein
VATTLFVGSMGCGFNLGGDEETPPTVDRPYRGLAEAFRTPVPVPPGPDGRWHLVLPDAQILGEGPVLGRIDPRGGPGWSMRVPDEYALTGAPGGAHSAILAASGTVIVLLAGAPGVDGPVAVRAIEVASGRQLWERRLPSGGNQVVAVRGFVVTGHCTGSGCAVTTVADRTGTPVSQVDVPAARMITTGLDPVLGGRGPTPWFPGLDPPAGLWAIGDRTLTALDPEDGRVLKTAPRQPGPVGHAMRFLYRLVLITRPAGAACAATVTSYQLDDLSQAWTRQVRWADPRTAAGPDGCRYDPAQQLVARYPLVVPDADGALSIDDYTGRTAAPLPPGWSLLTPDLLTKPDGTYRELTGGKDFAGKPPAGVGSWASQLSTTRWVARIGDGLALCDTPACGSPHWRVPGALLVLFTPQDVVLFVGPREVVGVYPVGSAYGRPSRSPSHSPSYVSCVPLSGENNCPAG